MSKDIVLHAPGDYLYTRDDYGRVYVYEVVFNGKVSLIAAATRTAETAPEDGGG